MAGRKRLVLDVLIPRLRRKQHRYKSDASRVSRNPRIYTGLCGTITPQILFMSRNADAVSRPGASQISEQLVREVDKQTEQYKLVDQQDTAPHRAVMHEALGNEAHQPEQHNSRDDRARMMRERLDRLDVYPVAQPMRGASGRMLSHGVARLWDYFECAEEK